MDLGRLTLPDGRAEQFLLAAGIGLDAHVLDATDDALKRKIGPFAIAAAAVAAAPHLRPFDARIDLDGSRLHDGRVWQIVLPNTRLWGGAFAIAPGASPEDGLLDVVALRDRGRFRLLVDLAELLVLRHPHPSDVATGRGRRISIETERSGRHRARWHAAGDGLRRPVRVRDPARRAHGAGAWRGLNREGNVTCASCIHTTRLH